MGIQEQLMADMKAAMKSGDKARLAVIRNARAALQKAQQDAVKQYYDDIGGEEGAESAKIDIVLDDAAQQAVINKEIKRRRESADIYRQAGRNELAEQEEAEANILADYLPKQLSPEELRPQVVTIIEEMGLSGAASLGKLMPVLMDRFKGQADGRTLNQIARELLQ